MFPLRPTWMNKTETETKMHAKEKGRQYFDETYDIQLKNLS